MLRKVHIVTGSLALALISSFWLGSLATELLGEPGAVVSMKAYVVCGLGILIPSLVVAAVSGKRLIGMSTHTAIAAKQQRMPWIAGNGGFILLPCAVYLYHRAASGAIDATFYAVQLVELVAGLANITMLFLSLRDGLVLRRSSAPN